MSGEEEIDDADENVPEPVRAVLLGRRDPETPLVGYEAGTTPLMWTAAHGSAQATKLLLAAGAKVDARLDPPSRFTALNLACEKGHTVIAKLLLEHGADINDALAVATPLMSAASGRHLELMRFLLESGADARMRSAVGVDALTFVFQPPLSSISGVQFAPDEADILPPADLLLKAGADPNNIDDTGKTPLMCAAHFGLANACQLLLDAGADAALVDPDGDSAADWARLAGHEEVAEMLSGHAGAGSQ